MQGESTSTSDTWQLTLVLRLSFEAGQEWVADRRVCALFEEGGGYPALGEGRLGC